jgi:hypothetical protein
LEYGDFLLGLLSGIVLTIIGQVIGYYFTRKSLKTQQEHSERIFKMQLYQEDKKKALIELDELLKKRYKTFPEFKKSLESFLDGSSGIFLPDKLRVELRKEVLNIDAFLHAKMEELYGSEPEPEYPDYEDWIEALSPEEEVDMEVEQRLSGLKDSMRQKIRKYVSEE